MGVGDLGKLGVDYPSRPGRRLVKKNMLLLFFTRNLMTQRDCENPYLNASKELASRIFLILTPSLCGNRGSIK